MSPEQRFFIQILKDHLAGIKTNLNSSIDWNILLTYARIHEVEGIVFYQCKKILPAEIISPLDRKFSASLFYFKNREHALSDLKKAFNIADICSFTVKGLDIAACYPIPNLRTMGDVDIVVHKENKTRAGEVLEGLGYSCNLKAPDYDWSYRRDRLFIELHHQLFYIEPGRNRKQADFFNQCWGYVENGELDWSFHFLFILAHLRKHMVNSGAGFRMYIDVAAIIKNDPGINWEWVDEKLEVLEMGKFARICFALCERWFGVQAPIRYDSISDSFFEEATEKVFSNGVFGFNDIRNKNNVSVNAILGNKRVRWLSRIQMILRFMFPRYMHMRYIRAYSFIEEKPWLLPIAWIYRFIRLLMGKTQSITYFAQRASVSDEEVDQREEEMKRWGLLE